jgi:hypothetical protein
MILKFHYGTERYLNSSRYRKKERVNLTFWIADFELERVLFQIFRFLLIFLNLAVIIFAGSVK